MHFAINRLVFPVFSMLSNNGEIASVDLSNLLPNGLCLNNQLLYY